MRRKQSETSFGVIGLGRFGTALVKTLAEAGQEVIAVDKDEQKVKAVRKYTDYAFVVGMLNEESLQETGVQNCDTVTICIGEQLDVSILTTMQVIKMGIPHVISKANSQEHGEVLKQLGATVVYPEADMAVRIGKRLISRSMLDYIQELDVRRVYGINIIAVERDHQTNVEFSPQYRFAAEDIIAVIGKVDKIDHFEQDIRP